MVRRVVYGDTEIPGVGRALEQSVLQDLGIPRR